MKKLGTFIAVFLLTGVTALATTTKRTGTYIYERGYGNSFIFVEQGVEFAVFPDGQFDFNVDNYGPNFSAHANFNGVSISFNTGHSYDAYVQYDDFGAVVQIENVPIYYDYYGRIIQAGNIHIRYNNFGRVARVGGLYVHYNRFNRFSHYTGFINVYNRRYIYRPWHSYYVVPAVNFCVVLNRPYRRYYTPVRHTYYRPYRDNYRPRVSYNAGRRNARVANNGRRSDRYRQDRYSARGERLADNSRSISRRQQTDRTKSDRIGSRRNLKENRANASKSRRAVGKRSSDSRIKSDRTRTVTKRTTTSRKGNSGVTKRNSKTVERKSTPKRRVVTTKTNRKSSSVKSRSSNKRSQQRVAKPTQKRKATTRSSRSSKSKRSKGRRQ